MKTSDQTSNQTLNLTSSRISNMSPLRADYTFELTQERYGLAVSAHLSEASNTLPHDISERLRVARMQAVAKRKLAPSLKTATSAAVFGSGAAATAALGSSDNDFSWWNRIAAALPLIALVAGLISIQVVQNDRRANEVAEVDSALLLDDLPPAAYADPGFVQFLKLHRDSAQ